MTTYETIQLWIQGGIFLFMAGIFAAVYHFGIWKGGMDQWKVSVDGRLKRNDEEHKSFERQFRSVKP